MFNSLVSCTDFDQDVHMCGNHCCQCGKSGQVNVVSRGLRAKILDVRLIVEWEK